MRRLVGFRIASGLGLLVGLYILQLLTADAFPLLVGALLIALPVFQWATVYFFGRRAAERPDILSLRIRTQDATDLAMLQTAGAVLGLLVVLRAFDAIPPVDRSVFTVGLSFCLFMAARPALNWLQTWRPWRP